MTLLRLAREIGAIIVLGCKLANAQSALGEGEVHGTILDTSEGVIVGARVTLTETSKGWVRTSESQGDGSFFFASVIAGIYSIKAEMSGFSPERMDGLRIEVGRQAAVTLRLPPAGIQNSI